MPTAPRIIAFVGYARVGKDLACQLIGGYRLALADQLKGDLAPILRDRYGLDPNKLTPEQKEIVRPLYVAHGRVGRAIAPDVWIGPLMERLDSVTGLMKQGSLPEQPVCICDCRHKNEAWSLLRRGAKLIYIDRPGFMPANDEEERSVREIILGAENGEFALTTVRNNGSIAAFSNILKLALREIYDL